MSKNQQGQVYGYLRVSTEDQNLDNNKDVIQKKKDELKLIGPITWVEEKISGTVNYEKRELGKLFETMKEGDILIISELSRISRNSLEICSFLRNALIKKIIVYSLDITQPINGSLESLMLINMISFGAQLERERISQRTKIALAKRKAEGKILGRPKGTTMSKLDNHADKIKQMIEQGIKIKRIASDYCVTPLTMSKFIKKKNLKSIS